jgi:hypothetical protein
MSTELLGFCQDWPALGHLLRCRVTTRGEQTHGRSPFASATQLANEIRDRRIGCVELLDFYLARAERHNPALNAIIVWQLDKTRERARAADAALGRGERWGLWMSPAMAAGIEIRLWSMEDVVRLIEQREHLRSGSLLVG